MYTEKFRVLPAVMSISASVVVIKNWSCALPSGTCEVRIAANKSNSRKPGDCSERNSFFGPNRLCQPPKGLFQSLKLPFHLKKQAALQAKEMSALAVEIAILVIETSPSAAK